jgi:hypothetical protein
MVSLFQQAETKAANGKVADLTVAREGEFSAAKKGDACKRYGVEAWRAAWLGPAGSSCVAGAYSSDCTFVKTALVHDDPAGGWIFGCKHHGLYLTTVSMVGGAENSPTQWMMQRDFPRALVLEPSGQNMRCSRTAQVICLDTPSYLSRGILVAGVLKALKERWTTRR